MLFRSVKQKPILYLAVNKDGTEVAFNREPFNFAYGDYMDEWMAVLNKEWDEADCIKLPPGTIKKLTGKEITYNDNFIIYE